MMVRTIAFFSFVVLALTACETSSSHKGSRAGAVNTSKIYVIQEDMPAEQQSLASGRDLMNRLVRLGKKEEHIEATPVTISSLAEDSEKTVAAKLGASIKSYSFKGKSKPENVKDWLAGQGVNEGRVLDTEVTSWGVKPYPKDKYHYIIYVNTKTALTDLKKGSMISFYSCTSDTSSVAADAAPSKYELLKDDKALIKKLYKERSRDCAARTAKEIVG